MTPEQRRRNIITGLVLAAIVVVMFAWGVVRIVTSTPAT